MSNVNVQAVRSKLDGRLLVGRSPVEAAAEVLWLDQRHRETGIYSGQTVAELAEVTWEWLASQVGGEVDVAERTAVNDYVDFLKERVDLDDPLAIFAVDRAWHDWRAR